MSTHGKVQREQEMEDRMVVYTDNAGTKFNVVKINDRSSPDVMAVMERVGGRYWVSDGRMIEGRFRIVQIRARAMDKMFYLYDPETEQHVPNVITDFNTFKEAIEAGAVALSKVGLSERQSPDEQVDDWFKHQEECQEMYFKTALS